MAESLKKEPELDVELIDGNRGEFTVGVDGRKVVEKSESLPAADEVLASVTKALHADTDR